MKLLSIESNDSLEIMVGDTLKASEYFIWGIVLGAINTFFACFMIFGLDGDLDLKWPNFISFLLAFSALHIVGMISWQTKNRLFISFAFVALSSNIVWFVAFFLYVFWVVICLLFNINGYPHIAIYVCISIMYLVVLIFGTLLAFAPDPKAKMTNIIYLDQFRKKGKNREDE